MKFNVDMSQWPQIIEWQCGINTAGCLLLNYLVFFSILITWALSVKTCETQKMNPSPKTGWITFYSSQQTIVYACDQCTGVYYPKQPPHDFPPQPKLVRILKKVNILIKIINAIPAQQVTLSSLASISFPCRPDELSQRHLVGRVGNNFTMCVKKGEKRLSNAWCMHESVARFVLFFKREQHRNSLLCKNLPLPPPPSPPHYNQDLLQHFLRPVAVVSVLLGCAPGFSQCQSNVSGTDIWRRSREPVRVQNHMFRWWEAARRRFRGVTGVITRKGFFFGVGREWGGGWGLAESFISRLGFTFVRPGHNLHLIMK